MANYAQHAAVGFFAGIGTYIAYRRVTKTQLNLGEALLAGIISTAGVSAPDLIEPAIHPRHRGVAHSVLAGGSIARAVHLVHSGSRQFSPEEKFVISFVAIGYISHLVLENSARASVARLVLNHRSFLEVR